MKVEGNIQQIEQSINQVVTLKTFVDSIQPVWQALNGAASEELQKIRQVGLKGVRCMRNLTSKQLCEPENYQVVHDLINSTLNEDVTYSAQPLEMRNQRTYAIKVTSLFSWDWKDMVDSFSPE
jgi:DNA mismatch repair protein MSH4